MKEGLSLEFATIMFQTWFKEKGKAQVGNALRKAGIEHRLLVSFIGKILVDTRDIWYMRQWILMAS